MTIEPARVLKAIEKLEQIDPTHEFAYERAFLAFLSVRSLPAVVYPFHNELILYRTRPHDNDVLFEDISEITNPKPHLIKNFARCNRPFQSKFYCSEDRPTSFMELVNYWVSYKKPGDHLYATVGRWQISGDVPTLIVTSPDKELRTSDFDLYHGSHYDEIVKEFDKPTQEASHIFYRYLYDKFRKSAKNDPLVYIITAAYCNTVLALNEPGIAAVCYPSVPFGGQGINFAFNADFFAPERFQLTNVMRNRFKVYALPDNLLGFRENEAIDAKSIDLATGKIIW
ncbi:RES domain-containing protein [Mucilaginibacter gracilis]|uniref:RES domain-containing protein n=1 Tax=Mucilaginibacter gracilis TaxID=423350 RepID=A0A495IU06_9SPHI|nr:RES domain-containing protein [Mucilaginibacter gracilis]RKR80062.1 RES domain-containing protein [Mucilaginibacter gracilis]